MVACRHHRHHHRTQENPRNRLSKFTYVEGDPSATRQSEIEFITTVPKLTGIHAAGWLDFEPGAFNDVSRKTNMFFLVFSLLVVFVPIYNGLGFPFQTKRVTMNAKQGTIDAEEE